MGRRRRAKEAAAGVSGDMGGRASDTSGAISHGLFIQGGGTGFFERRGGRQQRAEESAAAQAQLPHSRKKKIYISQLGLRLLHSEIVTQCHIAYRADTGFRFKLTGPVGATAQPAHTILEIAPLAKLLVVAPLVARER